MIGTLTSNDLTSQPTTSATLIGQLQSGELAPPVGPADYDEFTLLGSGTSYYLALAVADWMRRRGLNARAIRSCEALLDSHETRPSDARRLAIGFSRSGYSTELILANRRLAEAGFTTFGISCTKNSDLLTQADHGLLIADGFEDGLVMLRSFTSMLIAAQWPFGNAADRAAPADLPEAGRRLMAHEPALRRLAGLRAFDRFVFLGFGPAYPLACESALKIQEKSISTSEAYHTLDYGHGPKACADADTVITLFAPSDRAHGLALARDLKALTATLIVIGSDAAAYAGVADIEPQTLLRARHLHVGSWFIQSGLQPGLPHLFRAALARGQTTSLDLGWDPSGTWDTGALAGLLPPVSVIFPNRGRACSGHAAR